MTRFAPCLMVVAIYSALNQASTPMPTGIGTIEGFDGERMQAEMLFKHPNADLIVARSITEG